MSTVTNSTPTVPTDSKSSRRKKTKVEGSNSASEGATRSPTTETGAKPTGVETPVNGAEGSYESPYIKELYKYDMMPSFLPFPVLLLTWGTLGISAMSRRSW